MKLSIKKLFIVLSVSTLMFTSATTNVFAENTTDEVSEDIITDLEGNEDLTSTKSTVKYISEGDVTNMPEDALVDPFTHHIVSDTVPVRKGHKFIRWNLWTTTLYGGEKLTIEDYDIELVAVWEADQYNLSYISEGEVSNMPQSELIDFGTQFLVSEMIPERQGYDFIGWKLWDTILDKDAKLTMGEQDIELVAVWEKATFNVTYVSEGVVTNMPEVTEVVYKDRFIVSDLVPLREGYTFVGWQLWDNMLDAGDKLTMEHYDIEIVAVWDKKSLMFLTFLKVQ